MMRFKSKHVLTISVLNKNERKIAYFHLKYKFYSCNNRNLLQRRVSMSGINTTRIFLLILAKTGNVSFKFLASPRTQSCLGGQNFNLEEQR